MTEFDFGEGEGVEPEEAPEYASEKDLEAGRKIAREHAERTLHPEETEVFHGGEDEGSGQADPDHFLTPTDDGE